MSGTNNLEVHRARLEQAAVRLCPYLASTLALPILSLLPYLASAL